MTVDELKKQVEMLSIEDFYRLRLWMNLYDDDEWDRQIRCDSESGKLDKLFAGSDEALGHGETDELPTEADVGQPTTDRESA